MRSLSAVRCPGRGRYPRHMVRVGTALSRVAVAFVAALAIVAMHGTGASAHACADPLRGEGHAAMATGPVERTGRHAGSSHHEDRQRKGAGEQGVHCTVSACSAIVVVPPTSGTGPELVRVHLPLPVDRGAPFAACGPEPPVPRQFPNV